MEYPDIVKRLESTEVFKTWVKDHVECFLVHVFVTIEQDAPSGYQVGYYDPNTHKITSFDVKGDDITVLPPSEVFTDPSMPIQELQMNDIDLSTEDVLTKAHEVREDDYKGVPIMKVFFILQHIKEFGDVFNLTFVTQDLKTLNIKLDARSGETLAHSLQSLIHPDQ